MVGKTVTITTTPSMIVDGTKGSGPPYPQSGTLLNPTGGSDVYLGGANVDTGNNGYRLLSGGVLSLDIISDQLWAVVATGTQTLYILSRF